MFCFARLEEKLSLRILVLGSPHFSLHTFLEETSPGSPVPRPGAAGVCNSPGLPALAWKPGLFEVSSGVTRKHRQEKRASPALMASTAKRHRYLSCCQQPECKAFWESQQYSSPSQEAGPVAVGPPSGNPGARSVRSQCSCPPAGHLEVLWAVTL